MNAAVGVELQQVGRWLFGFCLALSYYNHLRNILTTDRIAYDRVAAYGKREVTHPRRLPWVLLAIPFALLVVAFCLRVHELIAAALSLGLLVAVRRRAIAQWREDYVVGLGKYVPTAAALSGYVVVSAGLELTNTFTPGEREHLAWEASCGIIAAAYVLAAVAKHEQSGWRWARADNVALLVAERAYGGVRWLFGFRMWAVSSPFTCGTLAKGSMFVEAAGLMFLVPALRWPFAGIATCLQLGIIVLLGYFEIEWILLIVALAMTGVG